MKQRLQRILSILCILALVSGCMMMTAVAEDDVKVVTIQWSDDNNYDGMRPDSVSVSYGGTSVTLNEGNGWTDAIVPASGTEWIIPEVPGYAQPSTSGTDVKIVTYSRSDAGAKTSLTVTAAWNDDSNANGLRPAQAPRVTLLADGIPCRTPAAVKLDADETSIAWDNLYVYKKDGKRADDQKITYSITADEVPGYTTTVSGSSVTYTLNKGTLKLNAELNPPAGANIGALYVTVSGPNGFKERVNYEALAAGTVTFENVLTGAYVVEDENASSLIEGYVIDPANSKVADAAVVKVDEPGVLNFKFTWAEEEAVKMPDDYDATSNFGSLEFQVYGPDGLVDTITYDQFDENGKYEFSNLLPGTYVVVERNAEGLVKYYSLQSDSTTGVASIVAPKGEVTASLYNKYKPAPTPEPDAEYVDIPVTKIWNDNGNKDGNRPGSITVNLYADGTAVDSHVLTADEGWQFTFTTKPRYNDDRKEIKYTVGENAVAWYNGSVNGYFITNDYNPETTTASVYKVWDDNDNERLIRPTSIAVTLLPTGTIYMLTAANDWSLTVDNLPTKLNGKDVTYSWKEEETVGYVLAGTEVSGNSAVFYNHAPTVPKIPADQPQAKVPGDMWFIFEEYETALGGELLINHVGDCFD